MFKLVTFLWSYSFKLLLSQGHQRDIKLVPRESDFWRKMCKERCTRKIEGIHMFLKFLKLSLLLEITVDSHVVLRNTREGSYIPCTHFLSMITSFKTKIQYPNQDIGSSLILLSFLSFYLCSCVCILCNYSTCLGFLDLCIYC